MFQFEENLEEFLDNKSNTSAFQNAKTRVLDLKDQLMRLKEKENEKEKARIKKAAGDKGKELTEDEIAQMMFEDEYETGGKVVVLFFFFSLFFFFFFLSFCISSLFADIPHLLALSVPQSPDAKKQVHLPQARWRGRFFR